MPRILAQAIYRSIGIFLLLGFGHFAQAQSHRALAQAAHDAMDNGDCQAAMLHFKEAEIKKEKPEYTYGYAQAAQSCNAFVQAAEAYEKVMEDFPDAAYQLGVVYKGLGAYAKAKLAFDKYLTTHPNEEYVENAKEEIKNCTYALTLKPSPAYTTKNLGKKINSDYSDFAPVKRGDTLFYSSFRFTNASDPARRKIAKAVYSVKGKKGKPMKYRFNSKTEFTANVCFLPDNSGVYYTQCGYQDGEKIHCDIYFKARKKRGWKKPIKLNINGAQFTSSHPSYYNDKETDKAYLLFSSNRPNSVGGSDIWVAPIKENHQLGEPLNLKEINTEGDEMTPYFDAENKELYFSSDRHLNIGGFDVFKVKAASFPKIDGEIEPLPQPINSPANDLYFIPNQNGKNGFLASNRTGARFIDKQNQRCCLDIYEWTFDESKAPKIIPPVEDSVFVETPEPPAIDSVFVETTPPIPPKIKSKKAAFIQSNPSMQPAKMDSLIVQTTPKSIKPVKTSKPKTKPTITLRKIESQPEWSMLPIKLYFDNDQPDNRTTSTTTKKTYLESYYPYRKRRLAFIQSYCAPIQGDEKEYAKQDLTSFFQNEVQLGKENLVLFSDKLLKSLQEGNKLKLILKGFTSPRAKTHYNDYLAARRITSVKNHFKTYQNGIFKPFINSGQLSFLEEALGETTAPTNINDNLRNKRLSIYSVDASRERRVEIVDIQLVQE